MYLYELLNFVRRNVTPKVYVCPADMLPRNFKLPAGFIINMSKAAEQGSHWVSLWIDEAGNGTYFDSYGLKPLVDEIKFFIKLHTKKMNFSKRQLQQLHSRECGPYAAAFIYYISRGCTLEMFLHQFGKNLTINDYVIAKMFKKIDK